MKKIITFCFIVTVLFTFAAVTAQAQTATESKTSTFQQILKKISHLPEQFLQLFTKKNPPATSPIEVTATTTVPVAAATPEPKKVVAPTQKTPAIKSPVTKPAVVVQSTTPKTSFQILPLTRTNAVAGSGSLSVQVLCTNRCPFHGAPTSLVEKSSLKRIRDSVSNEQGLMQFDDVAPGTYLVTAYGSEMAAQGEFTVYADKLTKGEIFLNSHTAASAQPQAGITFISPTAGERWVAGARHTIRWNPGSIPADHVLAIRFEGHWYQAGYLAFFSSTNDGVEEIVVPADATAHTGYNIIMEYKVNGKTNSYKSPSFEVIN